MISKRNIPDLERKQLFEWLRDNERELISEAKSFIKTADPLTHSQPETYSGPQIKTMKAATGMEVMDDSLIVDAVANLSMWYDSHGDISLPDSWKKSISERKNIPFIMDHCWSIESKIAKTLEVYAEDLDLKKLGIKSDIKTAQALIFKGEFNPAYNAKMYEMYKNGMVDQHSIGLMYIQIELGLNDPDDKTHYKIWEKYYPGIINKADVDKRGYFWAVKEQRIIENSAVLFGSNSMTPTLGITTAQSLQNNEPEKSTQQKQEPVINPEVLNRLHKIIVQP